jgi:hypothetical protein
MGVRIVRVKRYGRGGARSATVRAHTRGSLVRPKSRSAKSLARQRSIVRTSKRLDPKAAGRAQKLTAAERKHIKPAGRMLPVRGAAKPTGQVIPRTVKKARARKAAGHKRARIAERRRKGKL